MEVQDQLTLFYWVRLGSGIFVFISALMFIWSLLVPGRTRIPSPVAQPAE
jgi:nitric oxide reductase subunit B